MISKNSVPAAERTLDVFEAFSQCGRPLTLTELAREIGVPASSCLSLIRTFVSRGYLYSGGRRRTYYPTRLMLETARAIAANDPISERIGEAVTRLRDETGETAIAGKRQGDQIVYLDFADSRHTVRYTTKIGALKPLHSSSIGKAFLGCLDDDALAALLARLPLPRVTPNTVTEPELLMGEIEQSRRRGWYMTRGENVEDVMALAATVGLNGETLGLAVAGPMHRMERSHPAHVEALRKLCESLGERP